MKPLATVQLPISAFSFIVARLSDEDLVPWIRSFTEALAFTDPSKNDFAASLLNEVETYREKEAERQRDRYKAQNATTTETITADGEVINNRAKVPLPQDIGEVYNFGAMKKISESTCHQFWEINSKNNWQFKGKIRNWMGALIQFSKTDQA